MRAEPKAIEPSRDGESASAASLEYARRELAETQARWMEEDHAEAKRINAEIDRRRQDPEGCFREWMEQRREARRLEEEAQRR